MPAAPLPTQARPARPRSSPASRPAALFLMSAVWIVIALAGGRISAGIAPVLWQDAVREAVTAGMLLLGFMWAARRWVTDLRSLSAVGFVRRPGMGREFGIGAALGWAIALALVLPAVLTGNIGFTFGLNGIALYRLALSVVTLVAFALAVELVLAGLPVRLLERSVGSAWTMVAVVFVAVCLSLAQVLGEGSSLVFTALLAGLMVTAFLRTRAIWLPLGLQVGWVLSLQLVFGANSPYEPSGYGIVQGDTGGPAWLTGASFGPETSSIAVLVLVVAMVVLVRVTRDYAWHYTYQPIEGAAYAVEVAPPAEHLAEERKAAVAKPLVQIQGIAAPAPAVERPGTPVGPIE